MRQLFWQRQPNLPGAAALLNFNDLSHTIDMTADNVPAHTGGWQHSFFQVDQLPGLILTKQSMRQCFRGDVSIKTVRTQCSYCQAYTITGDAIAKLYIGKIQIVAANGNTQITTLAANSAELTGGFNNTCKHSLPRYAVAAELSRAVRRMSGPTIRTSVQHSSGT